MEVKMIATEAFLKELCNAYFISGSEYKSKEIIIDGFKPYIDSYEMDKLGSLIFEKKGTGPLNIMLIAHMDEVGLMVSDILENGFVKITNIGGVDPITLLAQEVEIQGDKNIYGVIGTIPKELCEEDDDKAFKIDELYIDTGYSKEALSKLIKIGDHVGIVRESMMLQNDHLVGHGLDDKAGVATLYETVKELNKIGHNNSIYYTASAQEEVGIRGAFTSTYKVNPDIVIAIDVGFGKTPELDDEDSVELGKGPGIILGSTVHKKLTQRLIKTAKDYGVEFQHELFPNHTGCDADAALATRMGIPCIGISVPIRYMHTNIETVVTHDVVNTGKLLARFINELNHENLEALLCF